MNLFIINLYALQKYTEKEKLAFNFIWEMKIMSLSQAAGISHFLSLELILVIGLPVLQAGAKTSKILQLSCTRQYHDCQPALQPSEEGSLARAQVTLPSCPQLIRPDFWNLSQRQSFQA